MIDIAGQLVEKGYAYEKHGSIYFDISKFKRYGKLSGVDLSKIQTLRLQQGIVQRWQKRFRMSARQATASGKDRSQKIFTIPVVTAELADQLRLPPADNGHATHSPARKPRARRRARAVVVDRR